MGRSRRRQRRIGKDADGGNGESPEAAASSSAMTETLAPTYVPVRGDLHSVVAPVLDLEGLDPWTEIAGPALALEDAPDEGLPALDFDDPAQLVLEPAELAACDEMPERVGDEAAIEAAAASAQEPAPHARPVEAPSPEPSETVAAPIAEVAAVEVAAPPPPPPPDPIEILYGEARTSAEAGHVEEAKMLYRQLLALHPAHVRARNNLALLLDAEGNHQGALAELDRALDVEAENGTLLVNRGALLGAMGRYAAAERDLKKVLRVEPAHAEALFNLGVVMTKKGLWSEAVPHLKRAVELEPARAAAHYYLGEALNHVDDLQGALASYQRAAELQPNNPRALYGLGIIYDRLARPDDAAQMYRRSREVGRR